MDTPNGGGPKANAPIAATGNPAFVGAALMMVLSVSLFTISHGFVRTVGDEIHPFEIAFATSLFSFTFYLPWLFRTRFRTLRTNKIRIHWVRAFFNVGGVCGWYFALTLTPLADAVALALTGPLAITLGAVLFLGVHSTFFGPIKYAILPQHLHDDEVLGGTGLVDITVLSGDLDVVDSTITLLSSDLN